ncbi:uncharacterized protein RCC_12295 [Ramularia collo-cygni]|uniref:Uncharacterized protein n=1 Tax=Ramularia collo-cygni TaxID=112498 RepID=A0A2D3UY88_9PEZI|nr:uncharacterized protein RCC_12295 [Ramularia collo-cygni]CZT15114.1 uncharacterized protein RCC_12295 [Ramularia collo-cygni]
MERSASDSSNERHVPRGYEDTLTPIPPWERRNMARVPYMSANSQPLNPTERQALQSLWATNEERHSNPTRPGLGPYGHRSFDQGYPLSHQDRHVYQDREAESRAQTPQTAPLFTCPRDPPSIPGRGGGARSHRSHTVPPPARNPPPFTTMPPTPPPEKTSNNNLSRSSTKSSSSTRTSTTRSISISSSASPGPSPRIRQSMIPSLPGTMSARESIAVVPAIKVEKWKQREEREGTEEWPKKNKVIETRPPPPLGKRFKSAFKDLFKREPVDESLYERIDVDRHWTDE